MDKSELRIWKKQILALILIYVACMLPIIFNHPKTVQMDCTQNYVCTVSYKYIWNIKRTANIYVNRNTKLRFYDYDTYHSGFINLFGGGLNHDPFGTEDFYVCSDYEECAKQNVQIQKDIKNFRDYIERPSLKFHIEKKHDTSRLNLICGILTILFAGLALTKRPINNIFNFIKIIFARRF